MRGAAIAWVVPAAVAAMAMAGCLPDSSHHCDDSAQCNDGVCITPPGSCAFRDDECTPSGLRFAEGTGDVAGTCVVLPIDAGVDAPLGHDEDGDGVADTDDNCPHVANAGQEDVGETDAGRAADGVGDACDPQPALSGNEVVLFDGFERARTSLWSSTLLVSNDAAFLNSGLSLSSVPTFPKDLVLAARIRPGNAAPGSNYGLAGAVTSATNGVLCTRRNQMDGSGQLLVSRLGGNGTVAAAPALEVDAAEILTMTINASTWRCDLVHLRGNATVMRLPALTAAEGVVGVASVSGQLQIEWIVAITLGPSIAPRR